MKTKKKKKITVVEYLTSRGWKPYFEGSAWWVKPPEFTVIGVTMAEAFYIEARKDGKKKVTA